MLERLKSLGFKILLVDKSDVPLLFKQVNVSHLSSSSGYGAGAHKQVFINEPVHEIFNKLVCATSKASDQPAHTRLC